MDETIPRDYVTTLEAKVASLTKELEQLKSNQAAVEGVAGESVGHESAGLPGEDAAVNAIAPSTEAPTDLRDWMTTSLGRVVCEPLNQPQFFGVSSGITLARLVLAAIRTDNPPTASAAATAAHEQLPGESVPERAPVSAHTPAQQAVLPPESVARHLAQVYFEYQTPHFPIIDRARVEQAIQGAYRERGSQPPISDIIRSRDLFTTFMVSAIALCNVHHPSGARPPQSEECFHSALSEVDKVFSSAKTLESLQSVLLVCQYVALCPSKGSLWLLTGTAVRMAVDLGLHWETEEFKRLTPPELLEERRRLWWSGYLMDRLMCITLGRPFAMADQGINVDLPTASALETPSGQATFIAQAHNCVIRLAQLESEIKHVLYSQFRGSSLAYPRANYGLWLVDIQARLTEWYESVPSASGIGEVQSSVFANPAYWSAIYNNALLLLYRPNPIAPRPSLEAIYGSFEAASKVIDSIRSLHRARQLDIAWKWVHHLFMAGLAVLYAVWSSEDLRSLTGTRNTISTLQTCGSTLSALSERWDGAAGCRDAFEALSSATVDWLVTSSAEETQRSRLEFEQQLSDLRQQVPPAFSDEMLQAAATDPMMMLSTSNFAFGFGENLNSAAEWPVLQQDIDWQDWRFGGVMPGARNDLTNYGYPE